MRVTRVLLMLSLTLVLAPLAQAADKPLRAGAAQADITAPIGTPMFAYTARSRVFEPGNNADAIELLADPDTGMHARTFVPSAGIHTRLRARAVVIERDGVPFALVQVDLGGIPYSLTQAVAAKIADTGITDERLLISATHSHSAMGAIWPNEDNAAYGFVGGDTFDYRSWSAAVNGISEAVHRANDRLVRARVGVGITQLTGASRNRASEPYQFNKDKPAIDIDPQMTVLRVDSAKGKPLAVWSNYAIHATSFGDGNKLFSADNPGYTERIVEKAVGKGAVNVWTNSNEGDISPDGDPHPFAGEAGEHVTSDFAKAHLAGTRVAAGVLRAWREAGAHMQNDLALKAKQSFLGFDGTQAGGEPVGPLAVLGGGGITLPDQQCAPVENMAGPGQGFKFPQFGGVGILPNVAPVSVWQIGDLALAALPSEVTRTMGLRIKNAVAQAAGPQVSHVALAGLTDGYLSYTATPEEYDVCQYEGSFTLFGRQQGPRYRDFTSSLAASLFLGSAPPAGVAQPLPFGSGDGVSLPPSTTTEPGRIITQPAKEVARLGRATFRWQGGDRSVEAPRGKTFVRLERRAGNRWKTVATDDSYADTVRREAKDVYLETFQFDTCDTLGEYRFRVTGRAYDGSTAQPYEVVSEPFALKAATLEADAPSFAGGVAKVRARYPSPGADALIFVPRIVTTGTADFDGVAGTPDPEAGVFTAPTAQAPASARVTDGCGNSTA
jgi:neutral ceramidase